MGDTVVVSSEKVSAPIGVHDAYSGVPKKSNLYNKAGLPATPFAMINGEFIFEEDDLEKAAAEKARDARYTDPNDPILQVAVLPGKEGLDEADHPGGSGKSRTQ